MSGHFKLTLSLPRRGATAARNPLPGLPGEQVSIRSNLRRAQGLAQDRLSTTNPQQDFAGTAGAARAIDIAQPQRVLAMSLLKKGLRFGTGGKPEPGGGPESKSGSGSGLRF